MQSPALKEAEQPSVLEPMNSRHDQLRTIPNACRELGETIGQFFLDHQAEILRLYPGPIEGWSVEQQNQALVWCLQLLKQRIHQPAIDIFGKGDFPLPRLFRGDDEKT